LLLYSMIPEKGAGYLTNAKLPQIEAGFSPVKRLNVRTTYYHVGAFHPNGGDWRFGPGTHRGDLFQVRCDLPINQRWRGHVVYETLHGGDFYTDKAKGYFLRFELSFLFRSRIPMQL
jgi:hypothetical protein